MECFTAYWNTETHEVTIKLTPELRADPINMHYALHDIIEDLQQLQKKNLKKAEKAGLDIHLGCDAWPECDESPGGCNHYNEAFEDCDDAFEGCDEPKEFKFLPETDLDKVSVEAVDSLLRAGVKHFGGTVSLYEYRMAAVVAVQDKLISMNK